MRTVWTLGVAFVLSVPASAGDEPHAAHTGGPFLSRPHTHDRAGTSGTARFATPSVSCKEAGGYVGGNRLRTATAGCSPYAGVFGWDWVGHGKLPNRIFLTFGPDKPHQQLFQPKYDTDKKK